MISRKGSVGVVLGLVLWLIPTFSRATDDGQAPERRTRVTISGTIHDEEGMALVGATVHVVGTTFGAGTNSKGEFRLLADSQDEYKLQAQSIGYETTVRTVRPPELEGIRFELKVSLNPIDEVVVTGLRTARPLKEVPVITKVISPREIEAIAPTDLTQLLEYTIPGIQFSYNSMSHTERITYQGMDAKSVLFLIDGERIAGEGADHNIDFNSIDMSSVDRVEVVRGAASAHYDSRAIGGVINIITKQAKRPVNIDLQMRNAFRDGQQYTATVGVRQRDFSSFTTGGYRQRDSYILPNSGVSRQAPGNQEFKVGDGAKIYGYTIWNARQRFSYTINRYLEASVNGSFYRNDRPQMENDRKSKHFTNYTASASLRYLMSEGHTLDLTYAFDDYIKDEKTLPTDPSGGMASPAPQRVYMNVTHTSRLNYTGSLGDILLLGSGVEWQREQLTHYMLRDSGQKHGDHFSLYASADWALLPALHLVTGLRVDQAHRYRPQLTPKLSLMGTPHRFLTLRGGWSMGYRIPTLKELYQEYDMGGMGFLMLHGNPNLKPEQSQQFEASIEFHTQQLNVTVSGFHNWFKDRIAYDDVSEEMGGGVMHHQYVNVETAQTTGVESTLTYRLPLGIQLMGAYTFTHDYQQIDGYNTSYVRPHTARANATYSHRWKYATLRLALNGQWGSPVKRYTAFTVQDNGQTLTRFSPKYYPSRFICSARATAEFARGLSVGLTVNNLLGHRDQAENAEWQLPLRGRMYILNLGVNLADAFNL